MSIQVSCVKCGRPLQVSIQLAGEIDPTTLALSHDVCPDQTRTERTWRVQVTVFEVPAQEDGDLSGDAESATGEPVGGFQVEVGAVDLAAAMEQFAGPMAERWQRLYETAHLADADATMQDAPPQDAPQTLENP